MNFRPFPPDSVAVNKTVHGQKMYLIVDFCNNLKKCYFVLYNILR